MKKLKNKLIVSVLALIVIAFYNLMPVENLSEIDGLKVSFLDVGQGDCTVIMFPDDKVMMIDAGENGQEDVIFDFLENNEISKIDYLVATHPHSDHIGGMPEIIENFDIGQFYMPKVTHTSKTFDSMINELQNKNMKINTATAGKTIFLDTDGVFVEFVAPVNDYYDNLNDYSAVVKLSYKDNSFLFCGDMEKLSEFEVLQTNADISCDVIKTAHHGSSTSSSPEFLEKANFDYAVISCGKNNDYGHPHSEVMDRLNDMNVKIYKTQFDGTITFICDDDIKVKTDK